MIMGMTVSVMITTRNRVDDLRRTCRVLKTLDPAPLEVLVTADGCTDDTVPVLRAELPEARLFIHGTGLGSVASRDAMMREARGDLVLSLDDDSHPEQPDFLARIVPLFENDSTLAVLHFPQRSDEYPETLSRADFGTEHPTRSFANSGAVIRRDAYLQLPGFEPSFFHMYEEPDYALQCIASGRRVIHSPVATIRHHYSGSSRSELRNHHRHARNELWSTLMRCPFPQVVPLIAWRVLSQARFAAGRGAGWLAREPSWWIAAAAGIPSALRRRRPVSWAAYRQWLSLP